MTVGEAGAKPQLRVDWCDHAAAKYAVEKWHYSKTMPAGRNVYIGAWEDDRFIGAILFGMGSGNATNGNRYGLAKSHDMAELTRVALTKHLSPVSEIVARAIKMVRAQSPTLRLLISMADPLQGHNGAIYQAMNWIYTGTTKPDVLYFSRGEWVHHRTARVGAAQRVCRQGHCRLSIATSTPLTAPCAARLHRWQSRIPSVNHAGKASKVTRPASSRKGQVRSLLLAL